MTDINSHAKKYYGLANQGATSYLNCVLQVLFMTKDFREAVTRDCKYIDPLLKRLFKTLKNKTATTLEITQKLNIQVYEQRDAAEYFEKILNYTSHEASQIFKGKLTHKNKCRRCQTVTDTTEPFWSLPLALESDSNACNVEKKIKDFFKKVYIDGDNQLYCEKCEAKADAKIKLEMTGYPNVLTLLLKRFRFDSRYQGHVKIKREVTVPETLKIPKNKIYELYAFVEHIGELRSGHYTVTIKCQDDDRWYNFNDTRVTLLDRNSGALTKSSTAYLLFYRRNEMHTEDTQHISEASTGGASTIEQLEQVLKTTGRDECEAAGKDRNLADIQRIKKHMTMDDVGRDVDKSKKKKEKINYSHVDNESSEQIRKRRKTDNPDNQEFDGTKSPPNHHNDDANFKPTTCSDHQDNQHILKMEQHGEGAQRSDKAKIDFCESGKNKCSYPLADYNQSKVLQNQGQKVGHKDVERPITQKNPNKNRHDRERESTFVEEVNDISSKFKKLNLNDKKNSEVKFLSEKIIHFEKTIEFKLNIISRPQKMGIQPELGVTQLHNRPRSVGDTGVVRSEKEDQTISIQRTINTQTPEMAKEVNEMSSKLKELNLNDKSLQKPQEHVKQFKKNSEADSRKNSSQTISRKVNLSSIKLVGNEEVMIFTLNRDYQQIPGDVDHQQTGDHTGKQKKDEEVEREQTREISKPYYGESGKNQCNVQLDNDTQGSTGEDSEIRKRCGFC